MRPLIDSSSCSSRPSWFNLSPVRLMPCRMWNHAIETKAASRVQSIWLTSPARPRCWSPFLHIGRVISALCSAIHGRYNKCGLKVTGILMSTSPTPPLSDKDAAAAIIARQPSDASFQSILRELAYAEMVRRGLADNDANRTVSSAELRKRIDSWQL